VLGLVAEHGSFLGAWSVAAGLSFASAALVWLFRRQMLHEAHVAAQNHPDHPHHREET
jgi:hypothetical protein